MKTQRTTMTMAAALLVLAGGCQGHGKYTQAHVNASQRRLDELKSANEFQMAEQAFLAGELEKALKKIEVTIQLNPGVARSHVLRGRILAEMNILPEALASFQKAEELEPDNVDAQYYQAVLYERVQNRDEALARYLRASEMAPSNPQFALAVAETLIDFGQTDRAVAFLKEREQTFRLDSGIQQLLGHMAMMRGEPIEAVARFGQARVLAPDEQSATEDLVHALMQVENFSEADFYLASLLRKAENEQRRDLMHLRVQCLQQLNRPVEARDILLKLTSADGSNDVQAWITLGHIALQLRDLGRVREAANRVVGLAPYRSEGYILRAMWQRRMSDFTGALTSLDDALEIAPNDSSIRCMQALVLVDAGRLDLAIRELQTAQRLAPDDPTVRSTLEALMTRASHPER